MDPGELREVQQQRLLRRRLGGEVEVLESPGRGEVREPQQPGVAASRTTTGNGLADMLLGQAATTVVGTRSGENPIVPYWGTYIQDNWKVSSRLTLDVGARFTLAQPANSLGQPLALFIPANYSGSANPALIKPAL